MNTTYLNVVQRHHSTVVAVSAAVTLVVANRVVSVTVDSVYNIELPPVQECAGYIYVLHCETYTSDTATIVPNSNDLSSIIITRDGTPVEALALNGEDDFYALLSTGALWVELAGYTTPE